MWDWFAVNSIWFLSAAAIGITILIFLRNSFKDRIARLKPEQKDTRPNRVIKSIFLWAMIALILLIIISVVAVILSSEGANAIINPEDIKAWLLEHGIIILAYIIIAYIIYRLIQLFISRLITGFVKARGKGRHSKLWFENRAKTLSAIISSTIAVILSVVALFMILSEMGQDIGPLLAGAGVVGIAVGFGAQSLVKDLFSGIFILLEDQYNKGDVVKIAGISGLVEEINLRRTILRDLEGIVHSIPNGHITTSSNYTRDWARVKLDISVGYNEDMDKVFAVINRIGNELAKDEYFKDLIKTPPQVLRVQNFGDSGIDVRILGDVHPMKQWEVTGELRKRLKKAFDDEGIEIPWPHVKLYFGESQQGNPIACKACSSPNLAGSKFCSGCGGKL